MARILFACLLAWVTLSPLAGAQNPPRIEVVFFQPEKFTDAADAPPVTDKARDYYLGLLRQHLATRAPRRLPEGGRLFIMITDVDRAGGFEPFRGPSAASIRVVRDVYPPRISLSFRLTGADGRTVAEGERKLTDLAFLAYPGNRDDPLRYEKKLLDDWLEREFPMTTRVR